MFAKLLKYEWKSTFRIQLILALSALGAGVLGAFLLRTTIAEESANPVLILSGAMGLLVITISLGAYVIASQLLLLTRFYKNKFTDQGYLTFTLPVNVHQIMWSAIVNILLWSVISYLVFFAAMVVMFWGGFGGLLSQVPAPMWQEIRYIFEEGFAELGISSGVVVLNVIGWVVSFVSSEIMALTAITLGAAVAKKHKILAAFGIYYGVNAVLSIIRSIVSFSVVFTNNQPSPWIDPVFQLVLYLGLGVGGYLLSTYLMRSKLNLS